MVLTDSASVSSDAHTYLSTENQLSVLNLAGDDYEAHNQTDIAYAAAEALGFQLFYSFDMSYPWDATSIASIDAKHASSDNTYQWNGKVIVSTFSGDRYVQRCVLG